MSRKTQPVVADQVGRIDQYNNLRDEAKISSYLMAYADGSTDTLKVLINEGNAYFGGTMVEFAGGYSPEIVDTTTSSRIDVLSLKLDNTITRTAGTEADSPVAPSVPAGEIPICSIYMRKSATKITDTDDSSNGYILKDLRPALVKPVAINFAVSDTLIHSNDTERYLDLVDGGPYTKIKECLINQDISAVRTKFDLRAGAASAQTVYGKIYKNGVALGTEQTNGTNSYQTKTEDLADFKAGDLIQIYTKTVGASGTRSYVRNFRLYWDSKITHINGLELETALPIVEISNITDQDPI